MGRGNAARFTLVVSRVIFANKKSYLYFAFV